MMNVGESKETLVESCYDTMQLNAVNLSEDLCGIFVKSVIEGSTADQSGCIMANDQIIEVRSHSTVPSQQVIV